MTDYIFDAIMGFVDKGTSVLLSVHDLADLNRADIIVILDEGKIVVRKSPEDLLNSTSEGFSTLPQETTKERSTFTFPRQELDDGLRHRPAPN